jgi:hypothetical protein
MHGIRAVRRDSGNKDPSSRKAQRVFFICDTEATLDPDRTDDPCC